MTRKIALHAVQPGMDPCAFSARVVLGDLVSRLPFPVQSVPHGPDQGDGTCRRFTALETVKKGSDFCIHETPP